MAHLEAGHEFLARLGKTKLRPGGSEATDWLIQKAKLSTTSKVLEVACNMGTTLIQLVNKFGCQAEGIDLSEDAIKKAQENIAQAGLTEKIKVAVGNALALPFADNSFDVIINEAMLTMLSVPQKEQALAEYQRVLKPDGLLLTQDVYLKIAEIAAQQKLRDDLSRAIRHNAVPLTLADWRNLLEENNFSVEQKAGEMSLLNPVGMIKDEGATRTLEIMRNALKKENREQFFRMFDFFSDNNDKIGYVAQVSRKIA